MQNMQLLLFNIHQSRILTVYVQVFFIYLFNTNIKANIFSYIFLILLRQLNYSIIWWNKIPRKSFHYLDYNAKECEPGNSAFRDRAFVLATEYCA